MYPLNVVPVGLSENLLPHVRRELANQLANVEAEFRDVDSAIDALRGSRAEPRLFIFHVRSAASLPELKRLCGTFIGRPVLALVESEGDSLHLLSANRAGASQVVPLPLDPADFREAMNCIGLQFGYAASESRVIAVSGVTGGCGATILAINLAYELAVQHGQHSILAELALRMGMLATYLDLEPKVTIHDLFRSIDRLDAYMVQQALIRVAQNFDVLPGPHAAIAPIEVAVPEVSRFLDYVRRLADVVVLDVPCTYNDTHFGILAAADQIVLVGEQKVPCIRALKLVRDTLGPRYAAHQHIVINRYNPRIEGFTVPELEKLLGVPRILTVTNDHHAVTAAVNHGRPLRLDSPHSPVLTDIDRLARALLGLGDRPHARNGASIFGRLLGLGSR